MSYRVIFHVDMNSFYASVESAFRPELKGKPLAIAGNEKERKGIIITCSYEARAYGIKTTMPLWQARRLCPNLIVQRPNHDLYRQMSQEIFEFLSEYTEVIERASIDEGYLDMTKVVEGRNPVEIAKEMQQRLYEEKGIPCSVGIGPNKFLAKTASDMKKPLGITILRKREVEEKLWSLPVRYMNGVGSATAEKLLTIRVETIGDLAKTTETVMKELLGVNGIALRERANGIDERAVDCSRGFDVKTIGHSSTFPIDMNDETEITTVLRTLCSKVARRLAHKRLVAYRIQLTLRYNFRSTVQRSKTVQKPIETEGDIVEWTQQLFDEHWDGRALRLIGVTVAELKDKVDEGKQLDLFHFQDDIKYEPVQMVVSDLQEKFGENIIGRAGRLRHKK